MLFLSCLSDIISNLAQQTPPQVYQWLAIGSSWEWHSRHFAQPSNNIHTIFTDEKSDIWPRFSTRCPWVNLVWKRNTYPRPDFRKILWQTYEKTYEKVWLTKNLGWASDYQKILQKKSYEKLRTKLCKTYEKLMMTLQVSYENVKFASSDVIRETLCQRLLLVEYFELKNNWQPEWQFLRNAFEKWLNIFIKKILGSRSSLTYKRLMKILRRT